MCEIIKMDHMQSTDRDRTFKYEPCLENLIYTYYMLTTEMKRCTHLVHECPKLQDNCTPTVRYPYRSRTGAVQYLRDFYAWLRRLHDDHTISLPFKTWTEQGHDKSPLSQSRPLQGHDKSPLSQSRPLQGMTRAL